MRIDTPQLPTHLLCNSALHTTRAGRLLRLSSLDELPQLFSVLMGHMSIVGPRPALFNQHDLMELRREVGIDILRPGITGWAQINGRDKIGLEEKVELETVYMKKSSFLFDIKIIFFTMFRSFRDIKH